MFNIFAFPRSQHGAYFLMISYNTLALNVNELKDVLDFRVKSVKDIQDSPCYFIITLSLYGSETIKNSIIVSTISSLPEMEGQLISYLNPTMETKKKKLDGMREDIILIRQKEASSSVPISMVFYCINCIVKAARMAF